MTTIVIIDDDPDDALVLREALETFGPHMKCEVFHDFREATEALLEMDPPAYIFLDAYMYPNGGKECLTLLGRMDSLGDTKIIVHSGALSQPQIDEYYKLGADHVMINATNHESLRAALK